MPGPGGMSLLDMMSDAPQQPAANPNLSSAGAQMPQYFGGGYGGGPGGAGGYGGGGGQMPPELAQYFGAFGQARLDDPRTVASQGGVSLGQLAGGLLPRGSSAGQISYDIPSDRGGFFSIEDLYNATRQPVQAPGMIGMGGQPNVSMQRSASVPQIAYEGANLPSTNNWRLLGMGPGWIMRNGRLINTRAPETTRGAFLGADLGQAGSSAENVAGYTHSDIGTGAWAGMPNNWRGATGWPGQATPYQPERWPLGNT